MTPLSDAALSGAQKWQKELLFVDAEVNNVLERIFFRFIRSFAPSFKKEIPDIDRVPQWPLRTP